jgi:hypothetical protein
MSWVYFINGYTDALGNKQPSGWYEVIVDDELKSAGEIVISRKPSGLDRVNDEWGLTNWGFLPFKVAFNLMWVNWLLYAILILGGLMLLKKKKYGSK